MEGVEKRRVAERRRRARGLLNRYRLACGRRQCFRRADEKEKYFLVDVYGIRLWIAVLSIIGLSLADALFTMVLIEKGVVHEANPLMAFYMSRSLEFFIIMKYLFTAASLFFLCLFKNFPITRIFMGATLLVYITVVIYEIAIFVESNVFV